MRRTTVTHCDATKRAGCAGTLTMERAAGGGVETLTVRVPLGTPISCGSEVVRLHTLQGKAVVATLVSDRNGPVARAIQVAAPQHHECG